MADKIITTEIDGQAVECRVCHRSSRDFQIEITKPFQSIQGGLHIPYFSAGHVSFKGEYGDERILQELNRIYGLGAFIAENIESLKEKFRVVEQQINDVSQDKIIESEFREIRIKLRRLLKQGEITDRYHQKVLRWWRREMETLRFHIEQNIIDPFFEENFPMIVPYDTKKQIVDILRGKKTIQGENHGC